MKEPDELMLESPDGARLFVRAHGDGPPLVLVHGTTADRDSFAMVEPSLAAHYRVFAYDRRGRGRSGDGADYSLELEVDDLIAVLNAAAGPAHVIGHSFGAVCALEAARRSAALRALVLYEPPLRMDRNPPPLVAKAFGAGPAEERLMAFHELCGISPKEGDILRSMPDVWDSLLTGMRTATREAKALQSLEWNPDRWATVSVPTLYLCGAYTNRPVYPTPDEFLIAVPHADVAAIEGRSPCVRLFSRALRGSRPLVLVEPLTSAVVGVEVAMGCRGHVGRSRRSR